ncbi:hypothetical protein Tco_0238596 [Tanacetum coccineum]
MPLDCQLGIVAMWGEWEGFVKWLMECCRVEVWEQNRVLAGFGIGGKIGKRCIRFTILASISLPDTSKQATSPIVLLLIERLNSALLVFSSRRLEQTATFSISSNLEVVQRITRSMILVFNVRNQPCDLTPMSRPGQGATVSALMFKEGRSSGTVLFAIKPFENQSSESSKEVGVLQIIHSNLVDWIAL